jgi:hypothetical protein
VAPERKYLEADHRSLELNSLDVCGKRFSSIFLPHFRVSQGFRDLFCIKLAYSRELFLTETKHTSLMQDQTHA